MRVLYLDSLLFVELIVDYLLLAATARICALRRKRLRMLLGALAGALYSALSLFYPFLQSPLVMLAAALVMLLCAFGGERGLPRIALCFLCVGAAFSGIVLAVSLLGGEEDALPVSMRTLLLSFAIAYALLTVVFRYMAARRGTGGTAELELTLGTRRVCMTALRDTGHSLRMPSDGTGIPIAEAARLAPLFAPEARDILLTKDTSAAEAFEQLHTRLPGLKLMLLPYRALGNDRGMLLAFKPDAVKLDGRERTNMWVAVSPTTISDGGVYSALVSGDA